jgi:hypothetical protein
VKVEASREVFGAGSVVVMSIRCRWRDKKLVVSGTTSHAMVGDVFVAPLEVSYPYKRTVGTLLSRFFTSLSECRLEGTRGSDGRVYFPPAEFDPVTGAQLTEWVSLSDTGTVSTWAWQSTPVEGQPLAHPFAWALITIDGADVPMLHAVDAGSPDNIATGTKVKVRWAEERPGGVTDIACFDVVGGVS